MKKKVLHIFILLCSGFVGSYAMEMPDPKKPTNPFLFKAGTKREIKARSLSIIPYKMRFRKIRNTLAFQLGIPAQYHDSMYENIDYWLKLYRQQQFSSTTIDKNTLKRKIDGIYYEFVAECKALLEYNIAILSVCSNAATNIFGHLHQQAKGDSDQLAHLDEKYREFKNMIAPLKKLTLNAQRDPISPLYEDINFLIDHAEESLFTNTFLLKTILACEIKSTKIVADIMDTLMSLISMIHGPDLTDHEFCQLIMKKK